MRDELLRQALHVAMGFLAILPRWLSPVEVAFVLAAALALNLAILPRLAGGSILREAERGRRFSWGVVLYPAVLLALVLVLHERMEIVAGAWAILAFGDGMATVAGILLGGPRLPWNRDKTWAGFAAFVLYGTATSAFAVRFTQHAVVDAARSGDVGSVPTWIGDSFLAPAGGHAAGLGWLLAACAACAVVTALVESARSRFDDNLTVGIAGAASLWTAALVDPALLARVGEGIAAPLATGALVTAALAAAALAAGTLRRSGAWTAWVVGTSVWASAGWRGFVVLAAFFLLASACTRLGWAKKAARGLAEARGGRRGAASAAANGAAGVLFAFLATATPYPAPMLAGMVAAFATAAADTVASEIGQAFGRRHLLVTTFRPVPAGTDGAVSIVGTVAGCAAAAAIAAIACALGLVAPAGIAIVTSGAVLGTTLESLLGATPGRERPMGHHALNFTTTLAGGIAAAAGTAIAG
jgi:uncharacterized protein (TIGR00297 family)